MATGVTQQAETYLQAMVDDLSISDTRYEQAEKSYRSLGEWLGRPPHTWGVAMPVAGRTSADVVR